MSAKQAALKSKRVLARSRDNDPQRNNIPTHRVDLESRYLHLLFSKTVTSLIYPSVFDFTVSARNCVKKYP